MNDEQMDALALKVWAVMEMWGDEVNPTPVAWFCEDESTLSFAEMKGCACVPLFTADQMQQAKADALREAAAWFNTEAGIVKDSGKVTVAAFQLNRMAAELETP